ncbi:MAG TPA: hypothetical protein VMT22_08045, partial [Terriglobales bacterium]|nr:hypothetical protein [Terriglobales bacterium]
GRSAAELLEQITVAHQGKTFRVELRGETGAAAAAILARPELQRILLMLQGEVARAAWMSPSAKSPGGAARH